MCVAYRIIVIPVNVRRWLGRIENDTCQVDGGSALDVHIRCADDFRRWFCNNSNEMTVTWNTTFYNIHQTIDLRGRKTSRSLFRHTHDVFSFQYSTKRESRRRTTNQLIFKAHPHNTIENRDTQHAHLDSYLWCLQLSNGRNALCWLRRLALVLSCPELDPDTGQCPENSSAGPVTYAWRARTAATQLWAIHVIV